MLCYFVHYTSCSDLFLFPFFCRLSKHGTLVDNTISCCPFVEMVVNFLGDLKVAANLVSKVFSETIILIFSEVIIWLFYRKLAFKSL